LRNRILSAAEKLGYIGPDPAARALAKGTTGAIGVVLTDSLHTAFTDEVATGFLGAVADALDTTGLALTLLSGSPGSDTGNPARGDVIPARDVAIDGALVYSCESQPPGVDWLLKRKLPLVFVDHEPVPGWTSINIDDRGGATLAAQHLIDLGHRRIGISMSTHHGPFGLISDPLAGDLGRVAGERIRGWLDVLRPAGIEPLVHRQHLYSAEGDRASAIALLDQPDPPTAIICLSDAIAFSVIAVAQDRGLRVPEDLSVVGFDDSSLAVRMRPQLTTIRQDLHLKGKVAIEALTRQLNNQSNGAEPPAIVLPTELVVRASTGPAPR
jgi:DNA-binding LacI/PurR family transcriptional regulator